MRHLISSAAERTKRLIGLTLDRLTGFPKVTIRYRGHWLHMVDAHQTMLALTEDSPRGTHARILAKRLLVEIDR